MLRAVLLHRRLQQSQWRSILFNLVFALNTAISKATKCVPYEVVFGRPAALPIYTGHQIQLIKAVITLVVPVKVKVKSKIYTSS